MIRVLVLMPAEDYSFRTTPQVRTFGEMIAHVADAQFLMRGVVKASFDYCDPVYESLTDAAGAAKVKWARRDMSKLGPSSEGRP